MGQPGNRHHWDIGEVLDRTDLAALLDQYAQPTNTSRGRRWHCPVPEHTDSRASVTMHTDGRGHERWRCWSGDDTHRGDAIDLIMVTRRSTRLEAIETLAQYAGMQPGQPAPPLRRRRPQAPTRLTPLDPAVVRYVHACAERLWQPDTLPVRQWLHRRGFTKEVLQANLIGADPGRHWMRRPSGLPRGDRLAAVFPALALNGTVRYCQTRYLEPLPDGPKFDNPAGSMGSNPRLAWTKPVGTRRPGTLIVCEGIPDAITAAQYGFRSAAVLGAQYPDRNVANRLASAAEREHLELLAIVDADPAGRTFGERLGDLIAESGLELQVIEPPNEGQDLNDWARANDRWADWIEPSFNSQTPASRPAPIPRPSLEVPTP